MELAWAHPFSSWAKSTAPLALSYSPDVCPVIIVPENAC